MKLTIAIITNNSEKWVESVLTSILPLMLGGMVELIIVDNKSTDNTVPIIVSTIGTKFTDEERYKFYIVTTGEANDIINKSKTTNNLIVINNKISKSKLYKKIEEVLK